MAKLAEIEERLAKLDVAAGQDLIFDLLAAYGFPQASITRLRSGDRNRSGDHNTVLWKKKIWDTFDGNATEEELLALLDRAQSNGDIRKLKPRFLVARNDSRITAIDTRTGQTLDAPLNDLGRHAAFFMPWAGAEQVRTETTSYVDIKVAQQMAKLYDEIVATNPELSTSAEGRRSLNTFFSRLLFCFFAEDTGVFPDGLFTQAITDLTAGDGSDTTAFLDQLFRVLDTPHEERLDTPAHFERFGYVNGSLFSHRVEAPAFSRKARNIVIDCGTLDWNSINPDIFGSMIQAVAAGEDRSVLGMHYTSIENILKVLNPLLFDDLDNRYEAAEDSIRKLNDLLEHLGEIKVFDPACGSGNFLIVAYKRLRTLEHRILQRLVDLKGGEAPLFADSRISLENFYGIEIDDFAHEIAKLSLWFAKHQMNQEYDDLFGIERPLIPLRDTGSVICANAVRAEWATVCPPSNSTFLCGNPPYLGSQLQTPEHKADFADYFEGAEKGYPRNLDYVSLWYLKAADWLQAGGLAAFVSTNSICQGQHVELLWERMRQRKVEIVFAHTSFLWRNQAARSAGVTCVVVGLAQAGSASVPRRIFSDSSVSIVSEISPYLTEGPADLVVSKSRATPQDRPEMVFGSMPRDGGHLLLTLEEQRDLAQVAPGSAPFIRPYVGASELLAATPRFCIWIEDERVQEARQISQVDDRVRAVENFRSLSKNVTTSKFAAEPHRFVERRLGNGPCLVVPGVSSERRIYIPMAYYPEGTVVSNLNFAVYASAPWVFAILQSKMHVAWIRTVAGRLESRFRYSNTLCYNTFPFPDLDEQGRCDLNDSALAILAAQERWPDRSLAELYDPDRMPANLRTAHEDNDALVDGLYRSKPFASDQERVSQLLAKYEHLVYETPSKTQKED